MVTFSHADQGTAEAAWAAGGLQTLPELPLGPGELVGMGFVVLAAHPDDETLGAGGLVASLHALGATVEVILCTAGEGSHPESPTTTAERLAGIRLAEFGAGLSALGMKDNWRFLGLPDRGLAGHTGVISGAVREAAQRLSRDGRRIVLVAPYRADGHADHDALGAAAAAVASQDGHGLLEYPVWYWHWATPDRDDWQEWVRFHLSRQAREAKGNAMLAHASQILPLSPAAGDEALLHAEFLGHFARTFEVFAWTPARDTSVAPHRSGDAERIFDAVHAGAEDPWNYTASWYERRKRALTLAALPVESYERGLEIGCSIGTLTADLASRCRALLAVDASSAAVRQAKRRLAECPGVSVQQRVVPGSWPQGTFGLLVVSEVGYYLAPEELAVLWDRVEGSLEPGGTLVLCHWRHPIDGWELDGDAVHALARKRLGWRSAGLYQERDFVLEILIAPTTAGDLHAGG